MAKLGYRKYPEDHKVIHEVEILQTAGHQPWHEAALALRLQGMTMRGIAKELEIGFGSVQRFLNPESKAKQKTIQAKRDKERRRNNPEYAEKVRTYNRRYMQFKAPGRNKNVER